MRWRVTYHALTAAVLLAGCGRRGDVDRHAVVVTPAGAALVLGDTIRFEAARQRADGSRASVAVTYSATGGTINDGVYVAGQVPGRYWVAAMAGDGVADTVMVIVTPPTARNHTTSFSLAENPISEGGSWINGGSAGGDWTDVSTADGLAIGHQVGAPYTDATAILTGAWGADQMATARADVTRPRDECFQEVELRLRSTIAPRRNTGYEVTYKVSQSEGAYVAIVRWNGRLGDFTYLVRASGERYALRAGDVVTATIVGNVITTFRNGVQIARATDSVFASGSPGMGFNLENRPPGCAGTNDDYGFTSFMATDYVPR